MDDTICERCGVNLTLRAVAMGVPVWPFCPHGVTKQEPTRSAYVQDQIPGGLVLNNYGPQPITVYSHSEARAVAAANGLEYVEKFCPTPGTNIDPAGVANPAGYMDTQTLENGKALLLRGSRGSSKEEEEREFTRRVYRPLPDVVLTESDVAKAHQATYEREVERGKRR